MRELKQENHKEIKFPVMYVDFSSSTKQNQLPLQELVSSSSLLCTHCQTEKQGNTTLAYTVTHS